MRHSGRRPACAVSLVLILAVAERWTTRTAQITQSFRRRYQHPALAGSFYDQADRAVWSELLRALHPHRARERTRWQPPLSASVIVRAGRHTQPTPPSIRDQDKRKGGLWSPYL